MSEALARAFLDGATDPEALPALTGRAARRVGRPSIFDEEMANEILERIASGYRMKDIANLPGFPGKATIFRWRATNDEFRKAYEAAMEWRTEEDLDRLEEIGADAKSDFEPGEDGQLIVNREAIARSALRSSNLRYRIDRRVPKAKKLVGVAAAESELALPGDNAKLIEATILAPDDESHPMYAQVEAWKKAAESIG